MRPPVAVRITDCGNAVAKPFPMWAERVATCGDETTEDPDAPGLAFQRYYFPLPSEVPPDLAVGFPATEGKDLLAAPGQTSSLEHPAVTPEHRSFYGHYDVYPCWNQYDAAVDTWTRGKRTKAPAC